MMKFAQTAARFALTGALVFGMPNLAQAQRTTAVSPAPSYRGAPGPIAGAGLPFLVVGYGVYWLIKRRRKTD
jgi:hypothetical protein